MTGRLHLKPGYRSRTALSPAAGQPTVPAGAVPLPQVYLFAARLARELGADTVIDLGCGYGEALAALAPDLDLIGVDRPEVIAECQRRQRHGQWLVLDLETDTPLPVSPERLARSVIVCANVIEHLSDPSPLLERLRQLLAHAPAAVLTTPERDLLHGRAHLGPPVDESRWREWNSEELDRLLSEHGLSVEFLGETLDHSRSRTATTQLALLAGGEGRPSLSALSRWLPLLPQVNATVCIVSPEVVGPVKAGGLASWATTLALSLARHGHEVTLLYTTPERCVEKTLLHWQAAYQREGVRLIALPDLTGPWLEADPAAVRAYRVHAWLAKQSFGVVVLPTRAGLGYYCTLAKRQGLAYATTVFVSVSQPTSADRRAANGSDPAGLADLVVEFLECETQALADVVAVPEADAHPADPRRVARPDPLPHAARPEGALPAPAPVTELVHVGRLETRKGLIMLCAALDHLVASGCTPSRVTFLGPEGRVGGLLGSDYVRERAAHWPWPVTVLSDLGQHEALQYLRAPGRLAVLAGEARTTLLECLGAGIPVLAADLPAHRRLIAAEDQSRVTFAPTAAGLTEALRGALHAPVAGAQLHPDWAEAEQAWVAWPAHLALRAAVAQVMHEPDEGPERIKVVVTTHNQTVWLRQCLEALKSQDDVRLEVVVVDDGSTTEEARQTLSQLEPDLARHGWRLHHHQPHHPAAARNLGWRTLDPHPDEYVLFLDAADLLKPDSVAALARATTGGAVVLTGCQDELDGPALPKTPTVRRLPLGAHLPTGLVHNVLGSGPLLIRADALAHLGGFAEDEPADGDPVWSLLTRAALAGLVCQPLAVPVSWVRTPSRPVARPMGWARSLPTGVAALPALVAGMHAAAQAFDVAVPQAQARGVLYGAARLLDAGQTEAARMMAFEAVGLARRANDPAVLLHTLLDAAVVLAGCRELNGLRSTLLDAEQVAETHGLRARFGQGLDSLHQVLDQLDAREGRAPIRSRDPGSVGPRSVTAAERLRLLLESEDLAVALNTVSRDEAPDLLALIRANAEAARADAEHELADGLDALAEIVLSRLQS